MSSQFLTFLCLRTLLKVGKIINYSDRVHFAKRKVIVGRIEYRTSPPTRETRAGLLDIGWRKKDGYLDKTETGRGGAAYS